MVFFTTLLPSVGSKVQIFEISRWCRRQNGYKQSFVLMHLLNVGRPWYSFWCQRNGNCCGQGLGTYVSATLSIVTQTLIHYQTNSSIFSNKYWLGCTYMCIQTCLVQRQIINIYFHHLFHLMHTEWCSARKAVLKKYTRQRYSLSFLSITGVINALV